MSEPKFIHLKVHSEFSIVKGVSKIKNLVGKTSADEIPALALTDVNNFFGVIKFYKEALKQGIKPIVGIEVFLEGYVANELVALTLLAQNLEGYKNLCLLISRAYKQGYKEMPLISLDWLKEFNQGVIVLDGGKNGVIGHWLLNDNFKFAKEKSDFFKEYFPDRTYLSLSRTGKANEEFYISKALEFAKQNDLPVVASNDVLFLNEEDFEQHEMKVAINKSLIIEEQSKISETTNQQYLKSAKQMCKLFADIPVALQNTVEIAKRCNLQLQLGTYFLPEFDTGNLSVTDFLVEQASKGLDERLKVLFPKVKERKEKYPIYEARLKEELEIINTMGFAGYFLIVMEFIQWSKSKRIPVGPGRGSGAGSLVAYCLGITDLDPIKFDLLFERFLNPDRVSMPDFDIDFCKEGRDRVIEHVVQKYGANSVSQIITFGTMAAKQVIRDVGRVLGFNYKAVDSIARLIPDKDSNDENNPKVDLEKAFKLEPRLKQLYESTDEHNLWIKELFDMAFKLEGVVRNTGKHAGGVVIAPSNITDFSALYYDSEGLNPLTHLDKDDVEYAGLVKFDFLGLTTLTAIKLALDMINARKLKNNEPLVDINNIDLEDKACFEFLQKAKTTAVFQLESRGMRDLIMRMQPDCFEDIIALVALFRPGPMKSGMLQNFVDRKHGREEIAYPDPQYQHERLKPILEATYGVIVYQEQVMQIAQTLAGYSLGQADILRRAMGKKKPEEMKEQKAIFQQGAKEQGVDDELALKIFDLVEKFAGYGFNKSHSAGYALIAYQTLWLKTHYPVEFMAAMMSAEISDAKKVLKLCQDCKNMGIKVLEPDINSSEYNFSVTEKGEILYGLGAVKGLGKATVDAIIEQRKITIFKDLFDLTSRVDVSVLSSKNLESLILSGSCDKLGPHRAALFGSVNNAFKNAKQSQQQIALGQGSLLDLLGQETLDVTNEYLQTPPWTLQQILEGELKTLGFYISGHPIALLEQELDRFISNKIGAIEQNDKTVVVAGLLLNSKLGKTKQGKSFCTAMIQDDTSQIEITFFSRNKDFDKFLELMKKDQVLIVKGLAKRDEQSNEWKILVDEIKTLEQARNEQGKKLALTVKKSLRSTNLVKQIYDYVIPFKGKGELDLVIYYENEHACAKISCGEEWKLRADNKIFKELQNLLGDKSVEVEY